MSAPSGKIPLVSMVAYQFVRRGVFLLVVFCCRGSGFPSIRVRFPYCFATRGCFVGVFVGRYLSSLGHV